MPAVHDLVERGVPDVTDTTGLPTIVAAEVDFLAGRFEPWFERGGAGVRARARVAAGEDGSLDDLADVDPAALDTHDLTAGAWAVSRLGSLDQARAFLAALDGRPPFLDAGDVPLGPRSLAAGPLRAAVGDLVGAAASLEDAATDGDARAPVWGALARAELGRVLLCARAVGESAVDVSTPERPLNVALLFFRAGGYRSLAERTTALMAPDVSAPAGSPTTGRLRAGSPWRVGFGVAGDVEVRGSKGLLVLRHLIERPDRAVPALLLDRIAAGATESDVAELTSRLADLANEGDEGSLRSLLKDDALRSRVSKLLTRTIAKLDDAHPLLGRHLRASVSVGQTCAYTPPAGAVWSTAAR